MIRARRVLLLIILFLAAGVLPVFSLYQPDIRYSGAGEVIPVGSRVYDLFDDLFLLCGHTTPSTSRPWTVSEAISEFSKINTSDLSSQARKLYDEISAIIFADKDHGLFVEFSLSPEVYVHSNSDFCLEEYWNQVHGFTAEDVQKDAEGLQTMRNLARNMTFLMKSIALGKEKYGLPEKEPHKITNFIR